MKDGQEKMVQPQNQEQATRDSEKEKLDLQDLKPKNTGEIDESSVEKIAQEIDQETRQKELNKDNLKIDSKFTHKESDLKKETDDITVKKKTLTEDQREIVDEFKRELKKINRSLKK